MSKVAVVGVQASVGHEILNLLAESGFSSRDVIALEVKSALGNMVSYGEDEDLDVGSLDGFDFSKVDVVVFATPTAISKKYIPLALAKNIKVIDCSNAFFGEPDVPMVVAGINEEQIKKAQRGLIAIPSAAVTQMLVPLQNIHSKYKIKRLVVSTYTSTSVYGSEGMDELFSQTRKIFMNDTIADTQTIFNKQIAYNVIPQVGEFQGDETICEWAMNAESKQVLGGDLKVHANCAIVPTFIGCGMFINVECKLDIDVDEAAELMKTTKGVVIFDKHVDGGYVSMTDVQGENDIYISRLRQDASVENGISFWCVADNLRSVARNAAALIDNLLAR